MVPKYAFMSKVTVVLLSVTYKAQSKRTIGLSKMFTAL